MSKKGRRPKAPATKTTDEKVEYKPFLALKTMRDELAKEEDAQSASKKSPPAPRPVSAVQPPIGARSQAPKKMRSLGIAS